MAVTIQVTRRVVVNDEQDRPALELECTDGVVKVSAVPRNGSRREPVKLDDLLAAVHALKDGR